MRAGASARWPARRWLAQLAIGALLLAAPTAGQLGPPQAARTGSSASGPWGFLGRLFPSFPGGGGEAGVRALERAVSGAVLLPGQPRFDAARNLTEAVNKYWNALRQPVAIVLAKNEGDVQAAVAFARARGLPLCVRAGGHDSAGYSLCAGVVIDVSPMTQVPIIRTKGAGSAGRGARRGR